MYSLRYLSVLVDGIVKGGEMEFIVNPSLLLQQKLDSESVHVEFF